MNDLNAWITLHILIGGLLKPDKCFYYLIDYICMTDTMWQVTVTLELLPFFVPKFELSNKPIKKVPV